MGKAQKRDIIDLVLNPKLFIKTLSYREFITSLSLALLLMAFSELLDYYSNENWVENNQSWIIFLLFCLILIGNHVFYFIEHGRQNNFIGRNLHDYIFLFLFAALNKLLIILKGGSFTFNFDALGDPIIALILFIIIVMIFELVVALLKYGLIFLKWRVL